MEEFEPQYSIAEVAGIEDDYSVDWVDKDLAYLSSAGEIVWEFASYRSGGFTDVEDVVRQAEDIVAEIEFEDMRDLFPEEDDGEI